MEHLVRFPKIFVAANVTMLFLLLRCFTVAALTSLGVWYAYLFHLEFFLSRSAKNVFSTDSSLLQVCYVRLMH